MDNKDYANCTRASLGIVQTWIPEHLTTNHYLHRDCDFQVVCASYRLHFNGSWKQYVGWLPLRQIKSQHVYFYLCMRYNKIQSKLYTNNLFLECHISQNKFRSIHNKNVQGMCGGTIHWYHSYIRTL